mmetsp:Transcript_20207/g.40255  ORF Transcript_20207/g.40255 Transcript_20207/m.40255 type:complete len:537 (+) Transcript_20207:157-1767(+)|eukprot:CAMPEP_0194324930 /NCGR_PEP_ID=MMETSP0171-20130528/28939_1 /TAXON_ID=218684 /ORGANISM="Corethron pennatum, Strain L29A3" /LENGTH=536 /DNA_ID=CAMNT_0039083925 /DNA_START=47 /DNA_END=1657 /DNA_ORIENTATION=-
MSYIPFLPRNPHWPLKDIEAPPNDSDVLCGRGGGSQNHRGNDRYRRLVNKNKYRYLSSNKRGKRKIALELVSMIYALDPPGRFLEKHDWKPTYDDIGEERAVVKVSQALREGAPEIRKKIVADRVAREREHAAASAASYPNGGLVHLHESEESYIDSPNTAHHRRVASSGSTSSNNGLIPFGSGQGWEAQPHSPSSVQHQQQYWNGYYLQQGWNGYYYAQVSPGENCHNPPYSYPPAGGHHTCPTYYCEDNVHINQHPGHTRSNSLPKELPAQVYAQPSDGTPDDWRTSYQSPFSSPDPHDNLSRGFQEERNNGNHMGRPMIPHLAPSPRPLDDAHMVEPLSLNDIKSGVGGFDSANFRVPAPQLYERKYGRKKSFEAHAENEERKNEARCALSSRTFDIPNPDYDDEKTDASNLIMNFGDEKSSLTFPDVSVKRRVARASARAVTASSARSCSFVSDAVNSNFNPTFDNVETDDTTLMRNFKEERPGLMSSFAGQQASNRSIDTFVMEDFDDERDPDALDNMNRVYGESSSLLES